MDMGRGPQQGRLTKMTTATIRINLRGSRSGVVSNCKLCGAHAEGTTMYLVPVKVATERPDHILNEGMQVETGHICSDCIRVVNLATAAAGVRP